MDWFLTKESNWRTIFGKRFDGEIALWFLLLYSFNRFWIEFLVADRNTGIAKYVGLSGCSWCNDKITCTKSLKQIAFYQKDG